MSRDDPRLAVAMLRLAVGLKADPGSDLEVLIKKTTETMGIDEVAFRRYLAVHMELLAASTNAPAPKGRAQTKRGSGKERKALATVSGRKGKTRSPVI